MRVATIKKASEINLHGVSVELDTVNKEIKGVRMRDGNGGYVEIRVTTSYSDLQVLVPAPPEKKKLHRLSGVVCGIDVSHDFDDSYAAREARNQYIEKARNPDDDVCLSIDEVEVDVPE